MKLLPKLFVAFLLLTPLTGQAQGILDTLSLKTIFYEPLLAGNRPEFASFAPNGSSVYYHANDSAMVQEELFEVGPDGDAPRTVENIDTSFRLSPTGEKILYTQQGDIWLADTNFENKQKLTDSKVDEYDATWGPDGRRVAFVQDGDVWILNTKTARLQQLTNKKEDEAGYSIIGWGGNKLLLSQYDTSGYKKYYFPEYVGRYVEAGATKRGVAGRIISVAELDSNSVNQLYEKKGYFSTSISSNGRFLALDVVDPAMKEREILVYDFKHERWATVFQDSTDGWIFGTHLEFAPEGKKLMFLSEKDGWNHIYTVNPNGSDLQQQSRGKFEVPWATWTGKHEMVFASTEVDPGERHLYLLNIENNKTSKLTTKTGYRQNFEINPDKNQLVYQYSYFNDPFELYSLDLQNPGKEVRLTNTIPEFFTNINWQQEDYHRFTGRDGETKLSMSVLEPPMKEPGKSYPVVVFAHGAGSLQNVYKGWSNHYYREYMFHQYLTTKGYYVIEVDFRHSTGYGRDFREDVTNWMGKYETQDIIDGINLLAEHYQQADTSRVGIYGGSYGGFMALYATSVAPEYFDAAAALRAVTNWDNYYYTNPWYTMPRLGKPKADSANYARSSPITYVDQLTKPVLILHGLIDNNVGFQDAAQYIDKLIQAGNKEFEMMMYPSERHSFEDPDAWFDEYSRIFEFFNKHLKTSDAK